MFNLTSALKSTGHEVIPFSIRYDKNNSTKYSKYFASPIAKSDEAYFSQQSISPQSVVKSFSRLFYSSEVEDKIDSLIKVSSPDIAYILHYLRKLSPSILAGIYKNSIPIVVRLSDYAMVCPQAHMYTVGSICDSCINKSLWPSIQNKCIKSSYSLSLLNYLATHYHRYKDYFSLIDQFICTNEFMYDVMLRAGFSNELLTVIPTLTDLDEFNTNNQTKEHDLIIYSGRIDYIKGVHVLISAMGLVINKFGYELKLKIYGTGDRAYTESCKADVERLNISNFVDFCGNVGSSDLSRALSSSVVSVVPSVWYENLPNSAIESMACGTPVVASNHGSLREVVEDGATGYLFNPGDPDDLARKLLLFFEDKIHTAAMSKNARMYAEEHFSSASHVKKLTSVFQALID